MLYGHFTHPRVTGDGWWWPISGIDDFFKSEAASGPRWVTLHPGGPGSDGVAVKIDQRPDGTAHVVAGAGGRLTGLRLDRLRTPEQWAQQSKENRQAKRQAAAQEREKAAGQAKQLGVQPASISSRKDQAGADVYSLERDRILRVAKVMGWDEKSLTLPDEAIAHLPPGQQAKARAAHHRMLASKSQEALRNVREGLVKSGTARAEAGLGSAHDKDQAAKDIALTDLIKPPTKFSGPGYQADTAERLQKVHADVVSHVHSLDEDGIRQEVGHLKDAFQANQGLPGEPVTDNAKRRGAEMHERFAKEIEAKLADGDVYGARKAVANAIVEHHVLRPEKLNEAKKRLEAKDKPELAKIGRESMLEMAAERRRMNEQVRGMSGVEQLKTNPTSYKDVLGLLQAEKQVAPQEKKARQAKADPTGAAIEETKQGHGGYQIVTKEMTDEQAQAEVAKDLENGLRENAARSLLKAYDGGLEDQIQSPAEEREHHLRQAVGIGAHQALANASFVFADHGGLSREAVDVLGAGPAAQLLAAHLRSKMTPEERKDAVEAIGRFHADEVKKDTEGVLKEAGEAYANAKALQVPEKVANGDDLHLAMEISERKREFLEEARESIGLAVGKYEATAALEFALQSDKDQPIQVKLPGVPRDTMIKQLDALGLTKDHYTWTHDGQNGFVELKPEAHQVLTAQSPSAEERKRNTFVRAVKAGEMDEENYIPPGFAKRTKQSFEQHGQDLPDLSIPFEPGDNMAESLAHHVGSRMASGEPVHSIFPSLQNASEGPLREAIKAGKAKEYGQALDKLAPPHMGRDDEALKRFHSEYAEHHGHEPDRWQGEATPDWRDWKRQQEMTIGRDDGSPEWRRKEAAHAKDHPEPFGAGEQSPEHKAWEVKGRELQRQIRHAEGRRAGPADWQANFDDASERFLSKHHPDHDPIHKQRLDLTDKKHAGNVLEALHRTLAPNPALKGALKNPGEMSGAERKALREHHMQNVVTKGHAEHQAKADQLRKQLDEHETKQPEEFSQGLFGQERTPEHVEWKQKREGMARELADIKKNAEGLSWEEYASMAGGTEKAMELAAEFARGHLTEQFAHHYERITGNKLRSSEKKIANDDRHDYALNPDSRAEHRSDVARAGLEMRRGVGGKAGGDPVSERLAAREGQDEAREREQGMLLSGIRKSQQPKHTRHTLGHGMERQLAGLTDAHFQGMDPRWKQGNDGSPAVPVIPDATMNGTFLNQQRIAKVAAEHNIGIGADPGSGKSRIALAAFTIAHSKGKARRGLFAVPSGVVGQFGSEAQTWLQPGKFNTFSSAGTSRDERMAAYRDPDKHMMFIGHETLRDDLRHMVGKAQGWSPEETRDRLLKAKPAEVDKMLGAALHKHGAESMLDYFSIDEAHQMLNREGKPDSLMATLADSMMRQAKRTNEMSGTQTKNDVSELQDVLRKLGHPGAQDAADFKRRYDIPTNVSKEALRRLIDNYIYTAPVDPGTHAVKAEIKVPLHEKQKARLAEIDQAHKDVTEHHRAMKMGLGDQGQAREGRTEAMRKLYPKAFQDAQPEEHHEIAEKLAPAAGTLRDHAQYEAIHAADHSENAKTQKAVELAKLYKKNDPEALFDHLVKVGQKTPDEKAAWLAQEAKSPHHGKPAPGVMFVRSLEGVDKLTKALEAEGIKVKAFTGGLDAAKKAQAQQEFRAGKHDVMVISDAGAAGLNLQRGRYSVQLDAPMTWKTHAQRSARIDRVGQKEKEPHLYDLVGDHPSETAARERLAKKRDLHRLVHDQRESMDDTGLAGYHRRVQEEHRDRSGREAA